MKFFSRLGEFLRLNAILALFDTSSPDMTGYSTPEKPYGEDDPEALRSKLTGFSQEEILSQWVYLKFPSEHIVVLTDINVSAKNIQFWAKVPSFDRKQLLQDVVIAKCKDKTEVERLVDNIAPEFASAFGYSAGQLITYNKEEYE